MFRNLFLAELTKLFNRPLWWIELAIFSGVIVFMNVVMIALLPRLPGESLPLPNLPQALLDSLRLASMPLLGGLALVTLAGSLVSSDYQWRVLHLWISHGAARSTLFWARAAALLIPALALPLAAVLVSAPLDALLIFTQGGALDAGQLSLLRLAGSVTRTAFASLPYLSLAVLLAVSTRGASAPIGGGVAFILTESLFIQLFGRLAGSLGALAYYLPAGLNIALVSRNQAAGVPLALDAAIAALPLPAPWVAALLVAAWTLGFLLPALWLFRRQDLTD